MIHCISRVQGIPDLKFTSDNRVAGRRGNATLVVFVSAHHDIAFQPPGLSPTVYTIRKRVHNVLGSFPSACVGKVRLLFPQLEPGNEANNVRANISIGCLHLTPYGVMNKQYLQKS